MPDVAQPGGGMAATRSAWPSAPVRQAFDHQPVAVLVQGMADEGELRLAARALAVEPGIWAGGALMSVVGAALAVEIAFAVAPMGRRLAEPSFGLTLFI